MMHFCHLQFVWFKTEAQVPSPSQDICIGYRQIQIHVNTNTFVVIQWPWADSDYQLSHQIGKSVYQRTHTFDDLFMRPVQKIQRYQLLIEGLLKLTCESHPDRQLLEQALSKALEIAASVDRVKLVAEAQVEYFSVNDMVKNMPVS
jgi:hypothetical protein